MVVLVVVITGSHRRLGHHRYVVVVMGMVWLCILLQVLLLHLGLMLFGLRDREKVVAMVRRIHGEVLI
jgi:hypothetical protein